MAKRTKKKIGSGRSALKLESLEQRQLLATIVAGSGTEVGSNIVGANGNTFDQILLTGASVTVKADPNQIVRISFLDQTGDIVQTEFSGSGQITVSLEDLKTVGSAGYVNNNPDQFINGQKVNYVQGLASIQISESKVDTNVGIFSAGIVTNPGLFTGQAKQGGNNIADIARLIIVGDPLNPAGFTNFGGIRAGNTTFSADSGVVGIRAENIAVQNIVAIGDIDAKGSGVPTLMFNTNSQFQTVFVRGGDLFQTNGASFDQFGNGSGGAPGGSPGNGNNVTLGGFSFFNSTDGTTSGNKLQWATPVNQNAIRLSTVDQQTLMSGDWVYDWTNPQAVKVTQNGTDVSATFGGDWLAKGGIQAAMDFAFERRTFLGNVTISGDLPQNIELNMADAQKNVTFNNNVYGLFTVDGFGASIGSRDQFGKLTDGTLTIKGNLDGAVIVRGLDRTGGLTTGFDGQQNFIGAIVVEGSTGVFTDVRAEDIGNITIRGSMSGIFSTDVTRGNAWTPTGAKAGTGYIDVEGSIGNISVGYKADGTSSGGSIVNGTFQGMSGIGNVKVGGDIWGSPQNLAVFTTASNPGAAPTDVRNFGTANIGTIDVKGDVDLDKVGGGESHSRLIFINGNGTYGNITVLGQTTTNTVPGPQIGTKTDLIPGSEAFIRILSPFTDAGFKTDSSKGQKLVTNFDPDGVAGPLNDTYFVTAADVTAKAKIFTINADGTLGAQVDAKVGDRVPVVIGGVALRDAFGNVVYQNNTALYEGKTQTVPVFGPDVTTIVSGNRGNLDGVYNNFGRIEITGLLGAQQAVTGTINWTDSVDMDFGGVTLNSSGNQNQSVIGQVGTLGTITITNTAGAKSDLALTGLIGSPIGGNTGQNAATAFVALNGLTIGGFEDVRAGNVRSPGFPSSPFSADNTTANGLIINATQVINGINITTVAGVGNGTDVGTVSPSVLFDAIINLDNGTSESGQKALLTINTGLVNSTIGFGEGGGIIVDDGGNTGQGSGIGKIDLTSDYVYFNGVLTGRTIDAMTITGGKGIGSNSDTAVSFTGKITTDNFAGFTASASEGNVVFAPNSIVPNSPQLKKASFGPIVLTTAGTNNGGDITLGNPSSLYNADFGNITLTAGHKLFLSQAGTVIDNPGNITINFATKGNIGNLDATTTTGNISNQLTVQGNAGNITYKAGAAVVAAADQFGGAPGDLARAGSITATQTIWGTRGVTTMETFGQKADGSANTLDFTVQGVDYKILPNGSINATLNYAGASTATGDAFISKTGSGGTILNYNIIGNDDNADGTIAISEIGHGGNVNVSSVSGDIQFKGGSQLTDFTHVATMGNVVLKTGTFPQASGLITGTEKGDIELSFNDLAGAPATGGYEGSVGNITATTTAGDITFAQSRFDASVGNVTLTTGVVTHTGGIMAGNVLTTGTGVTYNGSQGLVKATATDVGTVNVTFNSNATRTATGNGYEFATQYGALTATLGAASFDFNNNGLITADEYGRTGDVKIDSQGGLITLNLNSTAYLSALEQSKVGNVTITNKAAVKVNLGANDTIGATADGRTVDAKGNAIGNGSININGGSVGAVGNLTATTDIGTITEMGTFGDVGNTVLTAGSYFDVDTVPNVNNEKSLFFAAGNIVLGNGYTTNAKGVAGNTPLEVNGTRGSSTYTVVENGAINGSVYYGGSPALATNGTTATSQVGAINLAVWAQDFDRNGNAAIEASEYGNAGNINITSIAGTVNLALGTDANNAAVLAKNSIPELKFGNIVVATGDIYDNSTNTPAVLSPFFTDGKQRNYLGVLGAQTDAITDVPSFSGSATIIGVGADQTNVAFATYNESVVPATTSKITGNRGTVGTVTVDTIRGTAGMQGTFNNLGAVDLEAGTYVDKVSATNSNAIAGTVNFGSGALGAATNLTITGTHGTATLHTAVNKQVAAGTVSGGVVNAVVIYGGDLAAGSTNSIVATTEASNINITALAEWYDIDGNGLITDLVNQNSQGVPIDEFANIGNIVATSAGKDGANSTAGTLTINIGTDTANGSLVGSSIGNLNLATNTIVRTAAAAANDSIVNGDIIVTGIAPHLTAGTVGNINATLGATGAGTVTAKGNFFNVGALNLTAGLYVDASNASSVSQDFGGKIVLGNNNAGADNAAADLGGKNTLNIAGTYLDSALSVQKNGSIIGEVFVSGTGGKNWTLTADYGQSGVLPTATTNGTPGTAIDVNFVAGFDADGAGGITAAEAGSIGNVVATSTSFGNVTVGVGGRAAGSVVGNVTATTGSTVIAVVGGADKFANGDAEIQGLAALNGVYNGTVGALTAVTKYGNASITGDLNNIGAVTLTQDATTDVDASTVVVEDPVVNLAGDIFFGKVGTPVFVAGTYGNLSFTTIDSSKLGALASKAAGLVGDTGTINATAFFAGASSGASTITAKSDRGAITLDLEAGFDKDNADADSTKSTGEDNGVVGAVSATSTDGNITLTLDSSTLGSSFGNVTLTTGTTVNDPSGAATVVSKGDILIQGNNDAETANGNVGTVGNVTATAQTGNVTFNGIQWSIGAISLNTGSYIDTDSNSAVVGEDPVVVQAGDIAFGLTIQRNRGAITATTKDISTAGIAVGTTGDITGTITVNGGTTATGITGSTEQGDITLNIVAGSFEKAADPGVTIGNANASADDFVGVFGDVTLTSLFGNISADLDTKAVGRNSGTDTATAVRFAQIGNVTLSTGSSYAVNLGASNDTLVKAGSINTTGSVSNGILGNVTGTTTTGNITFAGQFNNQVGNIAFTTGSYTDTTVLAAGDIAFGGQFATGIIGAGNGLAGDFDTVIGTVTLTAAGSVDNAGVGDGGNISVTSTLGGAFADLGTVGLLENGDQATFAGGAFNATVTDGKIDFDINASTTGFGAALPTTVLKSTGGSTFGGTGDVNIGVASASNASFSSIASLSAQAVDGAIQFNGNWTTPTVTNFSLVSDKGNVSHTGTLSLDTLAGVSNFDAVNAVISTYRAESKNGNVSLSGVLADTGALNRNLAAGVTDNRTFVLNSATLKAAGGAASTVSVTGVIGGNDITRIENLTFDVPLLTGKTTITSGGVANVRAHDLGTITFNGNADFAGGTVILASDINTTRVNIAGANYTANTAANVANKGANLDTIDALVFNGSIAGNAVASLITGNRAEIEASKIGNVTFNASVDPTTTVKYTAQDLDILASNVRGGVAQGEALQVFGFSTLDAASALSAFTIGNITVNHLLTGNSAGSTVFAGSSAFAGLGGMGDIKIDSKVAGAVQAPLLTATGGVWFAVGDGDGLNNATQKFDSTGAGASVDYDDVAAAGAGDMVAIGNVSINVGSSYVPPAVQNQDFGNVGGNAAAINDGLGILAGAIRPAAGDTAAARVVAATELYGRIGTIEMLNAGIRPDADGTDFVATGGAALPAAVANGSGDAGAFIAVAGDGTATADIADVINDLNPAVVALNDGEGRILGRVGVAVEYDAHEVVVYVL